MNRYIVAINRADDEDAWLFLVFADDTREYVNEVIIEAQKEFHFSDCCELMDYVCDTWIKQNYPNEDANNFEIYVK